MRFTTKTLAPPQFMRFQPLLELELVDMSMARPIPHSLEMTYLPLHQMPKETPMWQTQENLLSVKLILKEMCLRLQDLKTGKETPKKDSERQFGRPEGPRGGWGRERRGWEWRFCVCVCV